LNGAQIVAGPALHRPCPSQTLTPTTAPAEQAPALQTVPATWFRQLPLPSHVPSRPQVASSDAGHWFAACGVPPAGTNAQIPGDPWTLQAMHVPVQAVLQQRPSTQNPLRQSPSQLQVSPVIPAPAPAPLAVEQVCGLSAPPSDGGGLLPPEPPHPSAPTPSAITTTAAPTSAPRRAIVAARFTEGLASTAGNWGSSGSWQACRREWARSDTGRSLHH